MCSVQNMYIFLKIVILQSYNESFSFLTVFDIYYSGIILNMLISFDMFYNKDISSYIDFANGL